ncbi:sigma-70 family RNA polymerase sigma factor [Selenomonas ruminis]|uniref:RNA polymerase sigma factor SigS n=1 Tax=Selenomonas ruminis TaxID=2593411 RepID=A0A5D6WAX5_9FIRM|nr:sigma-70 family RNA polymerase sigma factor [Selenomonas sp. mPRGC5]TYZ23878.1 sigma-70 family RNA polymerase sigma factor [Selenomonas sp. mPRGC5]
MSKDSWKEMTDEEIVALYQLNGDDQLVQMMLKRYAPMIGGQTRWNCLRNIAQEDLYQEGQIGFFKAMRDYKPEKKIPFGVFAQHCVRCQFITAVKALQRLKNQPLNTAYSLDYSIAEESENYTLLDILVSDELEANPEFCLVMKEDYEFCQSVVSRELTPFDYRIFLSYVRGMSYQEIADEIGGSIKSVDNALQRSKRKMRRHIMAKQDITVEMFRNYLVVQQLLMMTECEDSHEDELVALNLQDILLQISA